MDRIELGLPDTRVFPGIAANVERWGQLCDRMNRSVFLHSEGASCEVGAPHIVSGALLDGATELVARINRFYARISAAYYERPDLKAEYLLDPMFERMLEIEAEAPLTTPLSRLDVVLEADGRLRMIEINSVGICLFHLRNLLYVVRGLAHAGFEAEAKHLDQAARDTVVDGFLRHARARSPSGLPQRPVIGAISPPAWARAAHRLFRAAFERAGCEYVSGEPQHLEVSEDAVRVRGTRVDVLWADFFIYMAYQAQRYAETRFPSRVPDFGQTPAQAAALLSDPRFLGHVRAGRVVNLSPARGYLALPKSLLSWVHRSDRPVDDADRAYLADHIARTFSARDRADGLIRFEEVVANRGDYLIKPCQYGGSHGVLIGRATDADLWRDRVTQTWDDAGWIVQRFHEPAKAANGEWVSLGLPNYDGVLGGFYFRTSPSLVISARDAKFIPGVGERA
jgi:hypothetical protein